MRPAGFARHSEVIVALIATNNFGTPAKRTGLEARRFGVSRHGRVFLMQYAVAVRPLFTLKTAVAV
jgi:hypothetical protein